MLTNCDSLVLDSITVLFGKEKMCMHHREKLVRKNAYIRYYKEVSKKKKISGQVFREVYLCKKCGTAYVTRGDYESLRRLGKDCEIDFKGNIYSPSKRRLLNLKVKERSIHEKPTINVNKILGLEDFLQDEDGEILSLDYNGYIRENSQ